MGLIISFITLLVTTLNLTNADVYSMAATIANQEFSFNYPTAVVWWDTVPEYIHYFTKKYNGLVITSSLKDICANETVFKQFVYDQTVIYVKYVEELRLILKSIHTSSLEPIEVIVVLVKANETRIIEFTQVAWEYEIAHIIFVTTNVNEDSILYTFFPYTYENCDNFIPVVVPSNAQNFFLKKYQNLNKCPIVLSAHTSVPYITVIQDNGTTIIKGFEAEVINLIVGKLNATLLIISNEEHERDNIANDSLKVGFIDLIRKDADVMLPAVFMNEKRYSVALTTYTYNDLTVVWIAPKRRIIYAWAKLILPFMSRITPLIILSFILFISVVKIIHRYGKHRELKEKNVLFQSFTLFLGLQAKFESRCWLSNTTYVLWLWYCLIVRIAYQGDLINGLHKVILEPPIRTVSDGLQNLHEVVGAASILELYKNTSLEKHFKVLEPREFEKYLHKVVNGENILQAEDYITITSHDYLDKVQFLEETVIRLPACIFVRARWPAVDEFRRAIMIFHQHGYLVYYYDQYKARHFRRLEKKQRTHSIKQTFRPLNIATLSSLFYALLLVYFVCFIVFCMEIIWFKIKARNVVTI